MYKNPSDQTVYISPKIDECKRGTRNGKEIQIADGPGDDGIGTERMKVSKACGNRGCYPGEIHCSPGTGGGCCPRPHPVCCGNGIHCRRYGPC